MALIFGISRLGEKEYISVLFHLSNLVLCTTVCYITSLGISAVLRYHYMRNLEDQLANNGNQNKMVHWNSFISPITTKNPLHMYNVYTRMNYICYSFSTVCPILFCVVITSFQYFSIEKKSVFDHFGIVALSFVLFLSIAVYFISSVKAQTMYQKAIEISLIKREERLKDKNKQLKNTLSKSSMEMRNILRIVVYFVYPKKKDAQKLILLMIGFLTGSFFDKGNYLLTKDNLKSMLIVCFVIDFLVYQARYQWNDIRGVKEDQNEQKHNRLPVEIMGNYPAIIISFILLTIRVCAAFFVTLHLKDETKTVLFVSLIIILVCTLLYEISRSFKNVFLTFLTVSFGYAIRFGIGMWCANPQIWSEGFESYDKYMVRLVIIGLLLSYALLGEYSVDLSWIQEALFQKETGRNLNRVHYIYLFEKFRCHHMNESVIKRELIKEKGKIYDLWNATYIGSMVLLAGISCFLNARILLLELLIIICSILICVGSRKGIKAYTGILYVLGLIGTLYSTYNYKLFPLNSYIFMTQCVFTAIYIFLRFFFNPDFDFTVCCKKLVVQVFILLIGKETYLFLRDSSK